MLCYVPRTTLADRSVVVRFLVQYNPFYLLSAILMLAGLFALNDSLDWSPLPVGNVLILIATLNLYELLLIGMSLYLLRQGVRRDAMMLLAIEAFFLVDSGFLNSELFTQDLTLGMIVNLTLFVLAGVKVGVVFRQLHLPLRSGAFVLIMLQLGVLAVMPGIFKLTATAHHGGLPAITLYGFWWLVGGALAMYGVLLRNIDFSDAPRIDPFGRNRAFVGALLLLGMISIFAHLCTSNWVYDVRWYNANLAPILLGLAIAIGSLPGSLITFRHRAQLQLALPFAAILLSAPFPSALVFGPVHLVPLTPLRLILLGSSVVYLHGLLRFRQSIFAWLSVGCLLCAAMGSSVATIIENVMMINRMLMEHLRKVTPQRTIHWGIVSIIGAFALLLAGLAVSLKKSDHTGFDGS